MRNLCLTLLIFFVGCADGKPLAEERQTKVGGLLMDQIPPSVKDQNLSQEEAKQDLNLLIYVLQTGYGGTKYVPQEKFDASLAAINKIGINLPAQIKASELCKQTSLALQIIPDRHLSIWFNDKNCNPSPKTVAHVGPNFGKKKNQAWEQNLLQVSASLSVPVFSIHYFPPEDDTDWLGFREAIESEMMTAEAIVIDLRGNDGGSDGQGMWLAKTLYGDEPSIPIGRIVDRQTPEALTLFLNTLTIGELKYKKDGKSVPNDLSEYEKLYHGNLKLALAGELPEEKIQMIPDEKKPFNPRKGYDHPIYVITDRLCGSSGESTLSFLRKHPKTKVVGENTYGAIHFGNLGEFILPKSGIVAEMGTHFVEDRNKDFFEVSGYPPDVRTPQGETAIEWVKKDLAQKFDK